MDERDSAGAGYSGSEAGDMPIKPVGQIRYFFGAYRMLHRIIVPLAFYAELDEGIMARFANRDRDDGIAAAVGKKDRRVFPCCGHFARGDVGHRQIGRQGDNAGHARFTTQA